MTDDITFYIEKLKNENNTSNYKINNSFKKNKKQIQINKITTLRVNTIIQNTTVYLTTF